MSANTDRPQQRQSLTSAQSSDLSANRQLSTPYLDHNQQDLLVAALSSQASGRQNQLSNNDYTSVKQEPDFYTQPTMNGANGDGLFMSPAQAHLDNVGNDFTPDLDYLDNDFDFENADLGGEMIGALPGTELNGAEQHEKRKNPDENDDEEEGDAKRQEGEKGSKKPGRKPLTSEPTTKRKAQNRAAQRAFRERKEKHLKDLETKVADLTKAHDADKHEKALLKAQIERMQIELKENRKRLSLNGSAGSNRSPPLAPYGNQTRSNSNQMNGSSNNFSFDFPKFGALPGSQIFGNQALSNGSSPNSTVRNSNTPPARSPTTNTSFSNNGSQQQFSRENSQGRSMSPKNITGTTTGSPSQMQEFNPSSFSSFSTANNMHGFASTLPQMAPNPNDPFGDLFSPSILKSASMDGTSTYFQNNARQLNGNNLNQFNDSTGGDSTTGLNRVFQFNSNSSTSDSASPSASSASQWNANAQTSSCDTSPEPSHDSPATKVKDGETFCDKINPINNAPAPNQSQNQAQPNTTNTNSTPNFFDQSYTMPSSDTFDPVLFGDYRETNDSGLGGGDFTGGFFDEALNPQGFDFGSPSNLFGILDSPQQQHNTLNAPMNGAANAPTPSKSLMAEVEKTCQGGDDDYGLPGSKSQQQGDNMISCNNIWNQLQSNPDFQDGKFDLDGLCSELRAKARCSESGVMVDQDHVDAALRKLGSKDDKGKEEKGSHTLMFEQQSWDNVLKKLGGQRAV